MCVYCNKLIEAMKGSGMVRTVFISGLISLFAIENSHAYIDPGTGGMIIQIIAAVIVSFGVMLRLYWSKLHNIFKHKK